jgi:hypothetical protein
VSSDSDWLGKKHVHYQKGIPTAVKENTTGVRKANSDDGYFVGHRVL